MFYKNQKKDPLTPKDPIKKGSQVPVSSPCFLGGKNLSESISSLRQRRIPSPPLISVSDSTGRRNRYPLQVHGYASRLRLSSSSSCG